MSSDELEPAPRYANAQFSAVFLSTWQPIQMTELDLSRTQTPASVWANTNTTLGSPRKYSSKPNQTVAAGLLIF